MRISPFFRFFLIFTIVSFLFSSCGKDDDGIPEWNFGPSKSDTTKTDTTKSDTSSAIIGKPRFIWIDACANFPDYANSKENIKRDLAKVKDAGFTDIIVDVRPSMGDVLFQTSAVDQVKKLDYWSNTGYTFFERTATWDYLQAFIDAGHSLGLRVNAAINTFVGGNLYPYGLGQQGMLFRDSSKKDWASVVSTTGGRVNEMDLSDYDTKFLNPANDDVQAFVLQLLTDLAKYNLDGIYLDRCRFDNFNADFSDVTKAKFMSYLGVSSLSNWPSCVIVPGTSAYDFSSTMPVYFKQWMAFRVKVIHDFIVKARSAVKTVNSKIKFGVYVGAWYSTYYTVGVNWASPRYRTDLYFPEWANTDYHKYGFADQLDQLLVGAYASTSDVYGSDEWTMQGFCSLAKSKVMGDALVAGGPDVGNPTGFTNGGQGAVVTQSIDACINACDGYFLFDLIHVKDYNYWPYLTTGFNKYLSTVK
jgi:uncharacterized lipoprotein YddW (UPF0748 family)